MSLFNVGRVCVKLAGRDAGKKCVVLSEAKEGRVLVDGATRRREVNVHHLEPLSEIVNVKAGADTKAVAKVLEALGVVVRETKIKKADARPRRLKVNKQSAQKAEEVKAVPKKKAAPKKAAKKAEAKTE